METDIEIILHIKETVIRVRKKYCDVSQTHVLPEIYL